MGYSSGAARAKGKSKWSKKWEKAKSVVSSGVCCSWQRTNCVHLFPTLCTVTSPLLCWDTGPHRLTRIQCSSFLPCLSASCLSSLQSSLRTIAQAWLLQLNSNHILFMLRSPQQLLTVCKLISRLPTSLLKTAGSKSFKVPDTSSIWLPS